MEVAASLSQKKWDFKSLLFWHLILAIFISTFLWPVTRVYWNQLDVAFFKWINGSLEGHKYWQLFWAMANHKLADWLEDIVILCFFTAYVRSVHKQLRLRKVSQLVFCVLLIAAILYFVNRLLFRKHLSIPRESPTLLIDSSVRLSQEIPWMRIKDDSLKSFPGDHGTTALLFAATYAYFARGRLAILACLYAAFLCIPRMITGAHWFSDVVVGSGCITIFFLSWALCTPFHTWCTDRIEAFFLWIKR